MGYIQDEGFWDALSEPIGEHRPLRVVCMGAGYSGLMMAIVAETKLKHHKIEVQVYEKNNDVGGTWLVNRYPGCACDIPAHNYAYSFYPNANWPGYYASSEQIHAYLKDTADKYDCNKYFAYGHKVIASTWNEQLGGWELVAEAKGKQMSDVCDILINAGGVLSGPAFLELKVSKGSFFTQLTGICIQIVPKVAQIASHVDFFVRSPTWITPGLIAPPSTGDPEVDDDYNYAQHELERFAKDPEYLLKHRVVLNDKRINLFKQSKTGTRSQKNVDALFRQSMRDRLGSSEKAKRIAEWLTPTFPVGCRRLTPGPGFLEALARDNVDSHWDSIQRITETGIELKDGTHIELDTIFCATGFNTSFKPQFYLIGKAGVNLADRWTIDPPEAYFSITVPDMPNYFMFCGPNCCISNGSLIQAIQMTSVYIYKCITKLQTQGIKSMTISAAATKDYNVYSQNWLSETVWTGPCRSWYKRGTVDGRIVAVYGGSFVHFVEALRDPRWEDYDFEYMIDSNMGESRFAWLGSGFTVRETLGKSIPEAQTMSFDEYWDLMALPDIHY